MKRDQCALLLSLLAIASMTCMLPTGSHAQTPSPNQTPAASCVAMRLSDQEPASLRVLKVPPNHQTPAASLAPPTTGAAPLVHAGRSGRLLAGGSKATRCAAGHHEPQRNPRDQAGILGQPGPKSCLEISVSTAELAPEVD